ncbi:hypothetical protein EDC04DRAFT_2604976 [Pisolithus marmoratus]|nr:hypothetical protein EDC04DRAFT_2604976 [Pisolithus marmoratus]
MPSRQDNCAAPQLYSVQDFLEITRDIGTEATIVRCDLYRIPSRSFWYHEFLLVHVNMGVDGEKFMLIIERSRRNNGIRVICSDGGVAKDTVTVVRARVNHDYWQKADQAPICRGTIQWSDHSPRLSDVVLFANAATAAFKFYNCYIRQCYWYARIILASMEKAFSPCSKEGITSFSRKRLAIFGNYKPSQVQFLVEIHTVLASLSPSIATPNSLQEFRMAIRELKKSLDQLHRSQLAAAVISGRCGRTPGYEPNPQADDVTATIVERIPQSHKLAMSGVRELYNDSIYND